LNNDQDLDNFSKIEAGEEGQSSKISEESKKIKKFPFKKKKKYCLITDEIREQLIDLVENKNEKIVHAAKKLKINYSSAKSIYQIYKREGRSIKKTFKKRGQEVSIVNQTQQLNLSNSGLNINGVQTSTLNQSFNSTFNFADQLETQKDPLQIMKERLLQSRLNSFRVPDPYSLETQNQNTSISSQQQFTQTTPEQKILQDLNQNQNLTNNLSQNNIFPLNNMNGNNNQNLILESQINKNLTQSKQPYPQFVFYNQQQNSIQNNMNNIYYQSSPIQNTNFNTNIQNQNFPKIGYVPQLTSINTQMAPQYISSIPVNNIYQQNQPLILNGNQNYQYLNQIINPNIMMQKEFLPNNVAMFGQQMIQFPQFSAQNQQSQNDKTIFFNS